MQNGGAKPVLSGASVDQEAPEPRYRRGVGICVFNKDGLVFAAQRCDDDAATWQMPQGGIDENEDPQETAFRELREETSISSVEMVASVSGWTYYDYPTSVKCNQRTNHYLHFDGQAQRWFLLRFTGDDREINLETEHKEFRAWRWMPLEELPASVIGFKREVYEKVVAEFKPKLREYMQKQQHSNA